MKMKILELRPTQMSVGMKEVEHRIKKMQGMKAKQLEDYLHERRAPVIKGAKGRNYIVDHHHLTRACWEMGMQEIPIEFKADLSHLSLSDLWKAMMASHWLYPFDQFGRGPHDPIQLPENIRGLADDPYRSLAWMVREANGYEKTDHPFCEFHWADFFRKNLKIHPVFDQYDDALKAAIKLAKSAEAKHLPGFVEDAPPAKSNKKA